MEKKYGLYLGGRLVRTFSTPEEAERAAVFASKETGVPHWSGKVSADSLRVTKEHVQDLMERSTFEVMKMMDKTTVVACKLPSGFVIVESSSCINPANYVEELGESICKKRIENRLYELEGYRLHTLGERQ